jgi:hypothetical protein
MPVAAAVGIGAVGSIMSGRQQAKAAERASNAQNEADARAIAEQQRQFDALQALMKPYVQASSGVPASDTAPAQKGSLQLQQDLIGMNGDAAQRAAYDQIQNSAGFQAQLQQGQNAMLQSASATGGLRGGNTQAAMAQFAPALLNQAIGAQYQNLGGMTALGQNAAAMQGNAGMQSANQIGGLYQSQGANTAGYQLARGQANANMISGVTGGLGASGIDFANLGKYVGVSF